VDPVKTREAAARLLTHLSEFDPGASDCVQNQAAELRPLFPGDRWTQFAALVDAYAFAEAQAQLEEALKGWGGGA
jgi:hypothetical protein